MGQRNNEGKDNLAPLGKAGYSHLAKRYWVYNLLNKQETRKTRRKDSNLAEKFL